MSKQSPVRRQRLLSEAEGYIDLGMHDHALQALDALERLIQGRFGES